MRKKGLILSILLIFALTLVMVPSVFADPASVASAQEDNEPPQKESPPPVFNTEIVAPLPLPVTGNVDIPNGINANVTNFPATQDVRVTNSEPLSVQIVPAREPVQVGGQSYIIAGEYNNGFTALTYDVPSGKRLVIEFVSVRAFYLGGTNNPDEQMDAALLLELGGDPNLFNLERFSEVKSTTGIKNQVLSQSVRLYADPETTVKFIVYREDPTEEVLVNQRISGYLEAVP